MHEEDERGYEVSHAEYRLSQLKRKPLAVAIQLVLLRMIARQRIEASEGTV